MKRHSQRGIALILTLILLSVITFLTLAFLALSRREKAAANVNLDQTRAKQAADAATERATAQILAQILASTNKWAYDLMASTNYQSPGGYNPALGANIFNVGYTYSNGLPLSAPDMVQNVANLLFDPRPPVFVETNGPVLDARYFLDLNRNRRFDTNGWVTAQGINGQPLLDGNNQPIWQFVVGDPEFIGITADPTKPHSPTNRFLQRYAYLVVPAGKTIDLNTAHNQAKQCGGGLSDPNVDGYLRNEGVGTWEMNLAAGLEDLNTNFWGSTPAVLNYYSAYPPLVPVVSSSSGLSYVDALSLLRHRYNGSFSYLPTARQTFGPRCAFFQANYVDEFGNGPLLSDSRLLADGQNDHPDQYWPGGENPNAFFTHQDLFDPLKTGRDWTKVDPTPLPVTFSDRLYAAGTNLSTYDRYTFYRLLNSMSFDTGQEPADKINLNFVNVGGISETNLLPWIPVEFFTNTIDRLLRDPRLQPYPILSSTNIPVYPTNYYTPAVHRLLQVAANLLDATSTNQLPTAFRPIFANRGSYITIAGWREVVSPTNDVLNVVFRDPNTPVDVMATQPEDMIAGIPVVVGAKKGLPNFNEFAFQTVIQMSRKLELRRVNANSRPFETNQMYYIGLSNAFGLEAWNSYSNSYPRPLALQTHIAISWLLTNELGQVMFMTNYTAPPNGIAWQTFPVIPANNWQPSAVSAMVRGYSTATNAFRVPVVGGFMAVSNSAYLQDPAGGGMLGSYNAPFPRTGLFPVPRLWLTVTARVRYALIDVAAGRLVDFVNLGNLDRSIDLTSEFMSLDAGDEPGVIAQQWRTNRLGGQSINYPTEGIVSQVQVSLGQLQTSTSEWLSYGGSGGNVNDKEKAIDGFRVFVGLSPISPQSMTNPPLMTNLVINAPFSPVRKLSLQSTWQANDPLVHYLAGDLSYLMATNEIEFVTPPNQPPSKILANLGRLNGRTQPWGGNVNQSVDTNKFAIELKDPAVYRSDDWDFPNGTLPSLGWVGRIHRGTPWQTIYLKDRPIRPAQWVDWSGNYAYRGPLSFGTTYDDFLWMRAEAWPTNDIRSLDGFYTQPIKDGSLLDHFTATYDARTTRGQLSINNTNLAAWSPVLSGVVVMSNSLPNAAFNNATLPPQFTPTLLTSAGIAGTNSQLWTIVAGINRFRANTNLFPKGVFTQLGDLCLVPELTTRSPLLQSNSLYTVQLQRGLTDAAVERIPQQILGLLRGNDDPRFVVYAYGQALRAAPNSLVIGGPYNQLCTNYTITAETAYRTVIRVVDAPFAPRAVVESFNFLPPD